MPEFPFFLHVKFSLSVGITPWDDIEEFAQEVSGKVYVMVNEDDNAGTLAGTISCVKVSLSEAVNQGVRFVDVFDAHSDLLVEIYNAIFHNDDETKPELGIEPAWHEMLVLWECKIKPEFRDSGIAVAAFETAIRTFGSQGIIAAVGESEKWIDVGLNNREWRELGFKRIAGSQIVFRDNCSVHPYRE